MLILTFTAVTAVQTYFSFCVLFNFAVKFAALDWLTNTSREQEEPAFSTFAVFISWEVSAFTKHFHVTSQTRPRAKGQTFFAGPFHRDNSFFVGFLVLADVNRG